MLSLRRPPHPSHRPPGEGERAQAAARDPGGRLGGPRPRAARRAGGGIGSRSGLVRASPSPPAPLRSARPSPGAPIARHPPPRGAPARPAAALHLVLREHWGLRIVGCHVRAHAGRTTPPGLQRREREERRGGGGGVAAAEEAHSGSARGVQGRAAGRGGTRSAAAREAGGLGWSKRGGTPETRSRSGARGARPAAGTRAGGRVWGGWRLRPAAPGAGGGGVERGWGKGRETWLFRKETTLRFCSTTGLPPPRSPPR